MTRRPPNGDDGIDGVIREDKLGFNLIYIQAKRWDIDQAVMPP
jgi:restriction system protein